MGIHYSYRNIDGYQAPIRVILSKRGLGKTFGALLKAFRSVAFNNKRFVYVVETLEMVKTLSQNKGEKFFASILKYLESNEASNKDKKMLSLLTPENEDDTQVEEGDVFNKIQGGTIKVGGSTAGYIVALNDFANLKRNNFVDVKYIIIDEFIPEEVDIRSLKNPYKLVSIIQSIARTQDVIIYMLANTVRLNDPILNKLGFSNIKLGEIKCLRDKYGPIAVCEYVDNNKYQAFNEIADASVAGRFAKLLNETTLDDNTFKETCPKELCMPDKPKSSHMIFCLHGLGGSVRIHATKDHSQYYVIDDYGDNIRNRITFEEKYVTNVVKYRPEWKTPLMSKYAAGSLLFDTSTTYLLFKSIMKLDLN